MAAASSRGISRVLEKLENSVKNGEYYEAHQMYRTLYFRYLAQKKFRELKDMLYNGTLLFLNADQKTSGADLGLLLVEVLNQSQDKDCDQWSPKLAEIFMKIGCSNPTERDTFLVQSIKWSAQSASQGHPLLHQYIAKVFWDESDLLRARHHYILSNDGVNCGHFLIELHLKKGFKNEVDLFIAQAVLQFLCLRNQITAEQTFKVYTGNHPSIQKKAAPYLLPLLNFLWFLLQAVQTKKIQTFALLCEKYEPSIRRDPNYTLYLDKIGQIFFGVKPPPEKKSGGLFGNLIESFIGGLDDDSDDDTPLNSQTPSTSGRLIESNDMD